MGMNVILTPTLEAMVHGKVAAGLYGSPSEVLQDALRLMQEQDDIRALRLQQLRGDIEQGLASGPGELWDVSEMKRQLSTNRAAKFPSKASV